MRTIRLDPSDTFVFERAAEPGEWAVPGTFAFWGTDAAQLQGKARSAFRAGFLGTESLGWSTLVQIVDASEDERAALVDALARKLVDAFGAPDMVAARAAAEDEAAFAASLCEHPTDTLIAIHRAVENDEIRETFRTLRPRGDAKPARAFSFFDVEGEEEQGDPIDLKALANAPDSVRP